jgi:hypothetical protein
VALAPRAIEGRLRAALHTSPAVALTGPRQAGKTTLTLQLQAAGEPLHYFTLDDDATRGAAGADPEGFAVALPGPAVIDEAQRSPALLDGIGRLIERDPRPGRFLLAGSTEISIGAWLPPATASPMASIRLWPLSHCELLGARGSVIDTLLDGTPPLISDAPRGRAASAELVLAGGFARACVMTAQRRERYFADYVRALIEHDLPQVGELRLDPSKLDQLLRLLARRTSAAVNNAALARALGVDGKTVKAYVALLARLLLLAPIPAFAADLGTRQSRTPRLLLCDSGMTAALAGIDAAAYAAADGRAAARLLLETFVTMELIKQAAWSVAPVSMSCYRDSEQREVDLVIESPSLGLVALTVSATSGVDAGALRGLRLLRDRLGSRLRCAVLVNLGERTLQLGERLWALPLVGLLTH